MKTFLKDIATIFLIAFVALFIYTATGLNPGVTGAVMTIVYFATTFLPQGQLNQLMGFVRGCAPRSGGGTILYLIKKTDLESFTLGIGAGVTTYATVTLTSEDNVFAKYEFEPKTCEFKQDASVENGSTKVVKSIEFMLPKMSQASRDAVEEIMVNSGCGLVAIIKDANGQQWVVGYTEANKTEYPLMLGTSAGTTGKALTDANGFTVTLTCEDTEHARTFTGVVPVAD